MNRNQHLFVSGVRAEVLLVWKMKFLFRFITVFLCFLDKSVSAERVSVSVMEGDSVTLNTGVISNQQEDIKWYFNNIRIAQINGDLNKFCIGVQCKDGTERFGDRLKLDHQTGSLIIINITNTDSGVYNLLLNSSNEIIFNVTVNDEQEEMKRKSVKEGESVTLDPGVIKNPNDVMKWYFNEVLIAEITGDQSKICTDDQCDERFRDRLKLDHQTGSLTIMNIRNTDEGEYKLLISSIRFNIMKSFSVTVNDSHAEPLAHLRSSGIIKICVSVILVLVFVSSVAGEVYGLCRMWKQKRQKYGVRIDLKIEGQSVTLNTDTELQTDDHIQWMFGDSNSLIAEIKDEIREIINEGAGERFLDRLEIDERTGSLTIRNSRSTDSGDFKLQIKRNGKTSFKRFSVTISCPHEPIMIVSDQIEVPDIKIPLIQELPV